jgi:N6-adenosine-specific RNA methylase IME4
VYRGGEIVTNHRFSSVIEKRAFMPKSRPLPLPSEGAKFDVILADPPWHYHRKQCQGAAKGHYATMTDTAIMKMEIGVLAADQSVLFMWATGPKLDVALETMQQWGFEFGGVFLTWVKTTQTGKPVFGMGHYSRSSCEYCLMGFRGGVPELPSDLVLEALRREHSRKPDEARRHIEQFLEQDWLRPSAARGEPLRKLELFARSSASGWCTWGLERSKFDTCAQQHEGRSSPVLAVPGSPSVVVDQTEEAAIVGLSGDADYAEHVVMEQ